MFTVQRTDFETVAVICSFGKFPSIIQRIGIYLRKFYGASK